MSEGEWTAVAKKAVSDKAEFIDVLFTGDLEEMEETWEWLAARYDQLPKKLKALERVLCYRLGATDRDADIRGRRTLRQFDVTWSPKAPKPTPWDRFLRQFLGKVGAK